MITGMISVGKSSLLNKIFGLKLKVGRGQTTLEAKAIGQYKNKFGKVIQIMDSPGIN